MNEMKTTAERLKQIMKERKLRQVDILEMCKPYFDDLGVKINKSDLSQYVNGKVKPDQPKLTLLAHALNVNEPWLMGYDVDSKPKSANQIAALPDNVFPVPAMKRVPIIGEIACGKPVFAAEEYGELAELPVGIHADFALKAKGDSMIGARIHDGDVVFCKSADIVDNGKVAAVVIDDEATLKRFYYYKEKNLVILKPENPEFEDMIYTGQEIDSIKVLGQAVAFQSIIR